MATEPVHDKPEAKHEERDANTKVLAYMSVGLILVMVFVLFSMKWLFYYFSASQSLGPPAPFHTVRPLPPEPRLQVAPEQDWNRYWQAQQKALNSYGWVDKQKGTVRIPIDRAMDLLLQHGLPVRKHAPPADSAEVPTNSGGPDGGSPSSNATSSNAN